MPCLAKRRTEKWRWDVLCISILKMRLQRSKKKKNSSDLLLDILSQLKPGFKRGSSIVWSIRLITPRSSSSSKYVVDLAIRSYERNILDLYYLYALQRHQSIIIKIRCPNIDSPPISYYNRSSSSIFITYGRVYYAFGASFSAPFFTRTKSKKREKSLWLQWDA